MSPSPYLQDSDFTLWNCDALEGLSELANGSVDCCVTSPPYWQIRDNGGGPGELGQEMEVEDYVARLVEIFAEVKRVLQPRGTLWLNLGDKYIGKQLTGVPWLVAFALKADGWRLCRDVIWSKPDPMTESVKDRPTTSHEYVFMFSRGRDYYFDNEAIAEPATWYGPNGSPKSGAHSGQMHARAGAKRPQMRRAAELAAQHGLTEEHFAAIRAVGITDVGKARVTQAGTGKSDPEKQRLADEAKVALGGYYREFLSQPTRNARSVWTIQTADFHHDHTAVMPDALAERCILAGCPERGIVLDPFVGSGTTPLAARKLNRRCIGFDTSKKHCLIAAERTSQLSLEAEVA